MATAPSFWEAAGWAGHWFPTSFNSIKAHQKFASAFHQECWFLSRRKLLIESHKKISVPDQFGDTFSFTDCWHHPQVLMKEANVFAEEEGALTPPNPRFVQVTPLLKGDSIPEPSAQRTPMIILLGSHQDCRLCPPGSSRGWKGGSLNLRWKQPPFSSQGEHSNLGAVYLIESLRRQTGPTPSQGQSRCS